MAFDHAGAANPWYYEMPEIGWNYRLSDIHAALALSQLVRLDQFVEQRRALAQRYDELLAPLGRLLTPIRRSRGCLPAWHLLRRPDRLRRARHRAGSAHE
ncbi:MAG: DegT/DnrJ/EryC1/StrS family aminotransferase [Aliidongia sp.]